MTEHDNNFKTRNWKHWAVPEFLEVDGHSIACRSKGEGETLLFLHGAGMTRVWLPLCEGLSKSFHVVAPEHPGFGDSEPADSLKSIEDYALFYDALIRQLPEGPVHLVGHSLGGWIAAVLGTFYPERFATITLLTPAGLRGEPDTGADVFRIKPDEAPGLLFNGRQANYADLGEQEGEPEDTIHAYQEDTTLAMLMWHPRYDLNLERRLQRITSPTQVITAENDQMIATGASERFAELIPGAVQREFDGSEQLRPSGHLLHIEEPERVGSMISGFIQNVNAKEAIHVTN